MRSVLICPIGQVTDSLQVTAKSLLTVKSTDAGRVKIFSSSNSIPFVYTPGNKVFIRRYRIFSQSAFYGAKLLNLGFDGVGVNAFSFALDAKSTASADEIRIWSDLFAPALNEWKDVNHLYSSSVLTQLNTFGVLKSEFCATIDRTTVPDSYIALNTPDDLQIQLELDS